MGVKSLAIFVAPEFIAQLPSADYAITDTGYDSEELREIIHKKSSIPIIPRKINSTIGNGLWLYVAIDVNRKNELFG